MRVDLLTDPILTPIAYRGWRSSWLFPDGSRAPYIAGGDGSEGEGEGGTGDSEGGGAGEGGADETLTQKEVDALVGRARQEAKRQAIREARDQYGLSPDEVKALRAQLEEARNGQMSELEKREAAITARERETEQREAVAMERALRADVRAELLAAGAADKAVRRLTPSVVADLDDADGEPEEQIRAAITRLKEDMPAAFGTSAEGEGDDGKGGGKGGTGDGKPFPKWTDPRGRGPNGGNKGGEDPLRVGYERARKAILGDKAGV